MSRKRRRRLVEMSVVQVSPYLRAEKPLLWLRQKDATPPTLLPIAVGEFEATALQMGLGHEEPLRPISYDLLATMLDRLDVRTRRVIIHSVKDLVFLATVTIEQGARLREVDARPSDAVALALRTGAPIFVSDELLEVAGLKTKEDGETVDEAMSRFYDLEPQIVDVSSEPGRSPEAGVAVPRRRIAASAGVESRCRGCFRKNRPRAGSRRKRRSCRADNAASVAQPFAAGDHLRGIRRGGATSR